MVSGFLPSTKTVFQSYTYFLSLLQNTVYTLALWQSILNTHKLTFSMTQDHYRIAASYFFFLRARRSFMDNLALPSLIGQRRIL